MKLINPWNQDYHIHSSNFSDWYNTIDEIIQYANKIWLSEIAITDHSQHALEIDWYYKKSNRKLINRFQNVHNDVNVIFWVEADLMNEDGDICSHIQDVEPEFIILSLHKWKFSWDIMNVNKAYENALKRYSTKIKFIWHPTNSRACEYLEMEEFMKLLNHYQVPVELNWWSILNNKIDHEKTIKMLEMANEIYVNSDAHNLYEMTAARKSAFDYLNINWFIY